MSSRTALVTVLLVLGICVPTMGVEAGATRTPQTPESDQPRIVGLYPNPVRNGDDGEFITVHVPRPTDVSNWSLSDGESTVTFPNETMVGRVTFATAKNPARNVTAGRVIVLDEHVSLANGGETVTLRVNDTVVDTATYASAPEGERWRRTDTGANWSPLGATNRSVVRGTADRVRTFVLPDAPTPPVRVLRSACRRILLAGYTFTSRRVTAELRKAVGRGVRVRVLVEGGPVGGLSRREANVLDELVDSGASVEVLTGERARYDYHHAKYAVVDDRSLVLSENWKPSGTGGGSSRGWGVMVDDDTTTAELAAVFRADTGWRDTVSWRTFRRNQTFQSPSATSEHFPTRFRPTTFSTVEVKTLVAPDNAESELSSLLASADDSIRVQQVSIGDRNQPFLQAVIAAARRGVTVRILLSGAWYVREDNRALVEWLNERAAAEGLPLTAKLAEPRSRFEKIHAKGAIVDGNRTVVGSLNWNNHSARENREVTLVLEGNAVGTYYERVFRADWRGGAWRVSVGLLVTVVFLVYGAGKIAVRRVRFEG